MPNSSPQPSASATAPASLGGCLNSAAGPGGNPYGDASGHTCMAVSGPVSVVRTLETGLDDRVTNMWLFAEATLALLVEVLETAPPSGPSS